MDRCVVLVDAGYLESAAAAWLTGSSLRSGIEVAYSKLITGLISLAEETSGLPLMRLYWYDATRGEPTDTQKRISYLPDVKVRLGRMSQAGEQKGVDLRIGLDLVSLARDTTAQLAFVVTGDDDLSEAVEDAQSHGMRVVVLGVPNKESRVGLQAMSQHLVRTADRSLEIPEDLLKGTVIRATVRRIPIEKFPLPTDGETAAASAPNGSAGTPATAAPGSTVPTPADLSRPKPGAPAPAPAKRPTVPAAAPAPTSVPVYSTSTGMTSDPWSDGPSAADSAEIQAVAEHLVASWLASTSQQEIAHLIAGRPSIPGDLDRALLMDASERLNIYYLEDPTRHELRTAFWSALDAARASTGK